MSTQRQIRRGTNAENELFTGAVGETVFDTTKKRLVNHDGVLTGGYPIPNYMDIQNGAFTCADGAGTNTITLSLEKAPTAYAEYQTFTFKPENNNSGAVTLNVNSLGAKDVKKHDGTGSLVALDADDLRANIPVTVLYNGTEFIAQLGGGGSGGFIASTAISGTANWDTLVTAGLYKTSGTTYVNAPLFSLDTTGSLSVRTISGDANRIVQIWVEGATGDIWKRGTSNGGTTWTMWKLAGESSVKNRFQTMMDCRWKDVAYAQATYAQIIDGHSTLISGTSAFLGYNGFSGQVPFSRGYLKASTGTATNGSAYLRAINGFPSFNISIPAYAKLRVEYRLQTDTKSIAAQRYEILSGGAGKDRGTQNTSFFYYKDDVNSGKWVCVTDQDGTETVTNTGVAPTFSGSADYLRETAQLFRIEVNPGVFVKFYIDNVLVATHTKNTSSTYFGMYSGPFGITKTAGATARVAFFGDYICQAIGA